MLPPVLNGSNGAGADETGADETGAAGTVVPPVFTGSKSFRFGSGVEAAAFLGSKGCKSNKSCMEPVNSDFLESKLDSDLEAGLTVQASSVSADVEGAV